MSEEPEPRCYGVAPCEHEGCNREGSPCFLNADDKGDDPNGYYCFEHAQEAGFCYLCGMFWGGIESFDFGDGRCDNCRSEGDYDDGYWDNDDWEDEPFGEIEEEAE